AWANRGFHQRAALWMARRGITQLIDLGCGLPSTPSTYEAVQKVSPAARVLYVDHDPVVAARAHALLVSPGTTSAVLADVRDPESLLAVVHLDGLIELAAPAGLLCTAVLEHIPDRDDPWGCLARLVSGLAPGSYMALSHLTGDQMRPAGIAAIVLAYRGATDPVCPRSLEEITRFFGGLELIPPYEGAGGELCTVGVWGAEDPDLAEDESSRWRWAGLARRPHDTPHTGPAA
ncbi:MAG: SAM-dependent methyltransferase, partial [Streptosporangiaceae bacterium]